MLILYEKEKIPYFHFECKPLSYNKLIQDGIDYIHQRVYKNIALKKTLTLKSHDH